MLTSSFFCIYELYLRYKSTRLRIVNDSSKLDQPHIFIKILRTFLPLYFIILTLVSSRTLVYIPRMTVKVLSAIPFGYGSRKVIVEADTTRGLPRFDIIGLANKIVDESRGRIRAAIKNSDFVFPSEHITINLAPAELPKRSSHLDLPITLAILRLSKQLLDEDLDNKCFVGELALSGEIMPVRGIVNIVELAEARHYEELIIPSKNYQEAILLASKTKITPVHSLKELWLHLKGIQQIFPQENVVKNTRTDKARAFSDTSEFITTNVVKNNNTDTLPILDNIVGQYDAKRALTIALAGRHNILLSGPTGSGKSMLAKCARSLLPEPTKEELIEITKLHTLSKLTNSQIPIRPFRSPHHTSSLRSMLGGGIDLQPGEISLASRGILFLDEIAEFQRDVLEALRQPLEEHCINICTASAKTCYPANFILIGTMNPCPCGNYGTGICSCTPRQIESYRKRLSGPILDRIDMKIKIHHVPTSVLVKSTTTSNHEHETAKAKIAAASHIQLEERHKYNSELSSVEASKLITNTKTKNFILEACKKLNLSARSYFRLIRVSRTIADLDNSSTIKPSHIAEALLYRQEI